MKKENNTNQSDSSENKILDLISLEPSGFELKRNIGDISSCRKQPARVFYKKRCP